MRGWSWWNCRFQNERRDVELQLGSHGTSYHRGRCQGTEHNVQYICLHSSSFKSMLDGSFWPDSCSSFLIANTLNTVKKKIALPEKANLKLGTLKKGGSQVTEVWFIPKSLIPPFRFLCLKWWKSNLKCNQNFQRPLNPISLFVSSNNTWAVLKFK